MASSVIFLTVFLDLLSFGIVIPILPLYAQHMHASNLEIGVLLSVYSFMQLFFAPILGRLSDRAGRRPVLLISIFGSCVSQLGYAVAPSFFWLVVARGLAGVCGANLTTAQAYIADVTDEKSRAAGMGKLGAALGLGFVFGPAIAGILAERSPNLPFFFSGGLAAINFLLAWAILEEPRTAADRTRARTFTWEGLLRTVSTPRLAALMFLFFSITFSFANLEATFSLFLDRRFHFSPRKISYLFAAIGIIIAIVQGGLLRRLVQAVGERRLIIIGTFLMTWGFILQYIAQTHAVLYLAVAVMSIGNALNTPSLSSLISRAAGEQQGSMLGVSQSFGALARILGPVAGTFALNFGVGVPYITGGITMLLACVFAVATVQEPT